MPVRPIPGCDAVKALGDRFGRWCRVARQAPPSCPKCGAQAQERSFSAECGIIGDEQSGHCDAGAFRAGRGAQNGLGPVCRARRLHRPGQGMGRQGRSDARKTRYSRLCRASMVPYGRTIEKDVSDVVIAVYGAPLAREDDTGHAVRADLPRTVALLADECGRPPRSVGRHRVHRSRGAWFPRHSWVFTGGKRGEAECRRRRLCWC